MQCVGGEYLNEDRTACVQCPAGTFGESAAVLSADGCSACPDGSISAAGAQSAADCNACADGEVAAQGQSVCATCAPGRYANAAGMACVECNADDLGALPLESALYGFGDALESNAIEVHVHHLRRKLGDPAGGAGLIRTIRGGGYMLSAPVTTEGR